MIKLLSSISLLFLTCSLAAQNQLPQLFNASSTIDTAAQNLRFDFEIDDAEADPVEIIVQYSEDGGKTFIDIVDGLSGDSGFPITTNTGQKTIDWDYSVQGVQAEFLFTRIIADDRQAVDIQALVDQVDTNRLRSDLEYIASGRRHRTTGTTLLRLTKDTLEHLFFANGLQQERQNFDFSGYNAENIIGKKVGIVDASNVYVVDAHFDSVINSNGADDNASGTVGVMEACRILSDYNFEHTIKFIGFDLEEEGLVGSMRYLSDGGIESFEQVGGVINFEMIGYFDDRPNTQTLPAGFDLLYPAVYSEIQADTFKGNFITNVGNMNSDDFMLAFEEAASQYVPGLIVRSVVADNAGFTPPDFLRSDHASFWLNGHKALMITDGANFRNPNYHQSSDLNSTINLDFMANVIKTAIATIAEEAKIRHSTQITFPANRLSTSTRQLTCDFAISPNPADQLIQIRWEDCQYTFNQLEVYDLQGRRYHDIISLQGQGSSFQLDSSQWPKGVYVLKLSGPQGYVGQKVVIQH